MIRLKLQKLTRARTYEGRFHYLILHNPRAGRRNVYDILALNSGDPVVVGRELSLDTVKWVITEYEKLAPDVWFGDRQPILSMLNRYKVMIAKCLRKTGTFGALFVRQPRQSTGTETPRKTHGSFL